MASPANAIAITHTKELKPGDLVRVAFAPGHLGFFKYGAEAVFVVSKKTPDGSVFFSDSRAGILGPLRGTRQELLQELRKLTDFLNLNIYRPPPKAAAINDLEDDLEDVDDLEEEVMAPTGTVGNGPPAIMPPAILIIGGVAVAGLAYYFSNNKKKDDED